MFNVGNGFFNRRVENINVLLENSKGLPSRNLLFHASEWFNLKGNTPNAPELPKAVKNELAHASYNYKDKTTSVIRFHNFEFKHLAPDELAILYRILHSYHFTNEKNVAGLSEAETKEKLDRAIFHAHLFDIRDHLFRMCLENPQGAHATLASLNALNDASNLGSLISDMNRLLGIENPQFAPIFHSLVSRTGAVQLKNLADAKIEKLPSQPSGKAPKLKVLKLALENTRNEVGGLGSVIKASRAAHNVLGQEKVIGLHPFYTHDKLKFDVKFKGIITHQVDGKMVKSAIYKDKTTNEYLVQPDPAYSSIFDVGCTKDLYGAFKESARPDRYLYMASVAAVFTATYAGTTGAKSIDVVQADAWHVGGGAFEVLGTRLDGMREEAQLSYIPKVFLTHMLVGSKTEQGLMPTKTLTAIGGDTRNYPRYVNYTDKGLRQSDAKVFVSKGVASDALEFNAILSKGLYYPTISKGEVGVAGITNGINTAAFDICNPDVYGPNYTLKRTFTNTQVGNDPNPVSVETTDFMAHQAKIKKDLADAGIIADSEKELFLYVGRYSGEKGIDMLPGIVEQIKQLGGQCVIMGMKGQDKNSLAIIKGLKKLSLTPEYKGFLKVYDERSDQMDSFIPADGTPQSFLASDGKTVREGVKKGWLIRAAASVVVVPSHAEACGLVPMESRCTGALVVAPYHQGLRDMIKTTELPTVTNGTFISYYPPTGDALRAGANAVTYMNNEDRNQANDAVKRAYNGLKVLSKEERNKFMQSMHEQAMSTYDWVVRDENNKPIGGAALEYSKLYHRLATDKSISSEVSTDAEKDAVEFTQKITSTVGKIISAVARVFRSIGRFIKLITYDWPKRLLKHICGFKSATKASRVRADDKKGIKV